jgi:hypothetical protein
MSPRGVPHDERFGARERGLRRVRTATGWITVTAAAGAVVLAGGYASALPGNSTAGSSTAGTTTPAESTNPSNGPTTVTPTSSAPTTSAPGATGSGAAASATGRATQSPGGDATTSLAAPAQPPSPTTAAPHTTSGGS